MRRRDDTISLSCRGASRYSYIYSAFGVNAILPTADLHEASATHATLAPVLWKSPNIPPANVTVGSRLLQGHGQARTVPHGVPDRNVDADGGQSSAVDTRLPDSHARDRPFAAGPDFEASAFATLGSHTRHQRDHEHHDSTAPSCEDAHQATAAAYRFSSLPSCSSGSRACDARYRAGSAKNCSISAARHPTIRPPSAIARGKVPSCMRL
ncbi:hypothetical protein BLA6863_00523 [Burkholderia lata]|uniref:Uncharacterized protein n=1 Tax=Burkholderia lata (strain ATCC 17760 / DSM 23089 / LMG 22485 / NCIMB 9086 / R18194 / 383) TaxID=482957 RepID=A0A6P2HDQ9_BURL3|nr:hypothetical protein BLA6863_00523 [Burkholderia lata]